MKYTITLNQVGIAKAGLDQKTDLVDWAIIDYLKEWFFSGYAKKVAFTDPEKGTHTDYVWVNYKHLIENLPLIHIKDKNAISDRFKKLKKLGLIDTQRLKDNSLYFILMPACVDTCFYKDSKKTDLSHPNATGVSHPNATAQVVDSLSRISDMSSSQKPASQETKEIITYLNDTLGAKFSTRAADTQEHINARLKEGYTVEDFKMMIEYKCLKWKNDGKMSQYLRPKTLFNAGNFGGYLEDARRNLKKEKVQWE